MAWQIALWIVFALLCLWFMKAKLGLGFQELVSGLIAEFRSIPQIKSERGAVNMVGGLAVFAFSAIFVLFDLIGRLQRIATAAGVTSNLERYAVYGFSLFILAGFFLLCLAMVRPGDKSDL